MKTIISAFLIAISIAASGFFVSNPHIILHKRDNVVSVKGLAERTVKSDKGIWQIQFTCSSDQLVDLYKDLAVSQQILKTFLQSENFGQDTTIELSPVSIVDNLNNSYSSNTKVKRYIANAGIVLSTKNVDGLKKALQDTGKLIEQGIVITQSSVQYLFTQLNAIKPAMLDEATNNAKLAANSFAQNTKSRLGNIRDAQQGLFTISDAAGNDAGTSIMKQVRIVTSVSYSLQTPD